MRGKIDMKPETMGETAYKAYGDNRDWKDWRGGPMPTWEGLSEGIRIAWEVAAKAVADRVVATLDRR